MKNKLKEIREKNKTVASTLAKKIEVTLAELHDIENNAENNKLIGNKKMTRKLCSYFNIEQWELFPSDTKKQDAIDKALTPAKQINQVIFIDTSICMERYDFHRNFLPYFQRVCIPQTVMEELNKHKDSRNDMKSDKARRCINDIVKCKSFIETEFGEEIGKSPDEQIFCAVTNYAKSNPKINVFFLSKDKYHNAKKSQLSNVIIISEKEFHDKIEKYSESYDILLTETFWKYLNNNSIDSMRNMDLTKVDINGIYTNNYTPLCFAIMNKRNDVINFLLSNENVDINVTGSNPKGYGALHSAVEMNNITLVKRLLKHKDVYPNLLSKNNIVSNVTPLMIAASKGNEEIVNLLIDAGVSYNQQDTAGETALHKAAKNNHIKVYNLLKKYSDEFIIDSEYCYASEYINEES